MLSLVATAVLAMHSEVDRINLGVHFAFISRPILTSKGVNTSALYGFTQTLLDILKNQQPTHLAVAFDTQAPTQRHVDFPAYKATRREMPEDLSAALPHVRRMAEALNVPALTCDGYEADDIIGTLVRRAGDEGFQSYMVTSDKDFGQLIAANTFIYKPSRSGEGVEIIGLPEIQSRWGVQRPEQVVDVLALMGERARWQRHLPFAAHQSQEPTASRFHVLCRCEQPLGVPDWERQRLEHSERRARSDQCLDPSGCYL
jgi:5'-3' exonuclease